MSNPIHVRVINTDGNFAFSHKEPLQVQVFRDDRWMPAHEAGFAVKRITIDYNNGTPIKAEVEALPLECWDPHYKFILTPPEPINGEIFLTFPRDPRRFRLVPVE